MALVAVNPASRIMARVLTQDPERHAIDAGVACLPKLTRALDLARPALRGEPFYRLIHAEADGLPGVVIDRFGDVAVIQPNAAWAELLLPETGAGPGGGDRRHDGAQKRFGTRAGA